MGGIDLAATMDALADTMEAITGLRVYEWPNAAPAAPSVVIGYPPEIHYDLTFDRGADQAVFPVWVIVGAVDDRAARDVLSQYVSSGSAKELKTAIELDPTLGGVIQTCRVTDCKISRMQVGAATFLGAELEVEVTA